jgi:trimeric autotransporter adhesin
MTTTPQKFYGLDNLRALAIIMVFLFNYPFKKCRLDFASLRPLMAAFLLAAQFILCPTGKAQSFAINTDGSTANASALLDVKSTQKGVLIPRMSRAERNAITAPVAGLLVFQNAPDSAGFYYYTGTGWAWMHADTNADSLAWRTGGNTGTNANHFIGTADNRDLIFKRNNVRSGYISTTNTAWGADALNPASTGANNTAIGLQALLTNTTGQRNTAIGVRALNFNTTGSDNTAIGMETLRRNTGSGNTAVGFRSLDSNTAGFNNTAIGIRALISNTTGTSNSAVGANALLLNTTGSSNSALGQQALNSNTTGSQNTAAGIRALFSNTIGYNNTATGMDALYANTEGIFNTANGLLALASNTIGSRNTANGQQALNSNVTGSFNTALGMQAGYLATGSANVFLGYEAGYNETGNSKLYIANSSANPPLIYGDFGTGRVGLRTITPATILDVNGDFKLGANGVASNALLRVTVNIDVPAIAANDEVDITATIANASTTGSAVFASPVADIEAGIVIAWARVSAANTVKIRFKNTTGAPIDPAAINFVVSVLQ